MMNKKLSKEQTEKLAKGAKELARLKGTIAPFVKKKRLVQPVTRGKWRDGSLPLANDCDHE